MEFPSKTKTKIFLTSRTCKHVKESLRAEGKQQMEIQIHAKE